MNELEVQELKSQLEADYKKKSEAIEIVLGMLRSKNGNTPAKPTPANSSTPSRHRSSNTVKGKRVRGVLSTSRLVLKDLPTPFTRIELLAKLEEVRPDFTGKVTADSLRNTLNRLAEEGVIEVVEEASGTRPASYRLVGRKTEAEM
jgi:hypothetical protein